MARGALLYAIAFDLVVADTEHYHPKGVAQVFHGVQSLRARPWFPKSVRHNRAFRIEQWSDFTAVVKNP